MEFDKLDTEGKQNSEGTVLAKTFKVSQNRKKQVIDCFLFLKEVPISSRISLPARYSQDSV